MFRTFSEIESHIKGRGVKHTIALACAQDLPALEAVAAAHREDIANAVLIGSDRIAPMLRELGEDPEDYRIILCDDPVECAALAVRLVHEGEADMPMKGLMHTSIFMKAILNKETGLRRPGDLLCQASMVEVPEMDRLLIVSDIAVNIMPNKEQKIKIIENTVKLSKCIGNPEPRIALLSALEEVDPKIPNTVECREIAEALSGKYLIAGPLGLDNAVSKEAAEHKGISGPVAGDADILIVPDLWTGNIFYKSLTYFAHLKSCGALLGLMKPVILESRTDTPECKYNSILTAILINESA